VDNSVEIVACPVDVLRIFGGVEPVVPNGTGWVVGVIPRLSTSGSAR
jgi:hypothetical protein